MTNYFGNSLKTLPPQNRRASGDDRLTLGARSTNIPHQFVLSGWMGDTPVLRHYALREGRVIFEGWEEAPAQAAFGIENGIAPAQFLEPSHHVGTVLGLSRSGGESAYEHRRHTDTDQATVRRLSDLLLATIASGPDSLEGQGHLEIFNASLDSDEPLTTLEWENLVRGMLVVTARHTHCFTADGRMMKAQDVENGIAHALKTSPEIVEKWEAHFGIKVIADAMAFSGQFEDLHASLYVIHLLKKLSAGMDTQATDGTDIQWSAVAVSSLPEGDAKIAEAIELVGSLTSEKKVRTAGKFLSFLFRHSGLSEEIPAADTLVAPWSATDISALVKQLITNDLWEAVGHRSFRERLTTRENRRVNKLIHAAHFEETAAKLCVMDVCKVTADEFFDVMESTSAADAILDAALMKMAGHMSSAFRN